MTTERMTDEALEALANGRSTESVLDCGCEFALAHMTRELLEARKTIRGLRAQTTRMMSATPADDLRMAETRISEWLSARVEEAEMDMQEDGKDNAVTGHQSDPNDYEIAVSLPDAKVILAALSQPAPAPQPAVQMPRAWLDVMGERTRQMAVEGFTTEHDDVHVDGEIAEAALCYTMTGMGMDPAAVCGGWWPAEWSTRWWKPTDRRSDLVKAGALILAEIERLDRAGPVQPPLTDRQMRDQIVGQAE